jgi:hypothetical protein
MISPGRMFRETVRVLQASVCWNPHCNIVNLRPIVEVFASSNLGGHRPSMQMGMLTWDATPFLLVQAPYRHCDD